MKTKILILAFLLLSCFSVEKMFADEEVLEPVAANQIAPCAEPLYSNGRYTWNRPDWVYVTYNGIGYWVEFTTCYDPDLNIAILTTCQAEVTGQAPVNNPNLIEINKLALVKIIDMTNLYLSDPDNDIVYFHLGACMARFDMTMPAPPYDWGKIKLTTMAISRLTESERVVINPLIDLTSGLPIMKLSNVFRICQGSSCCRARYNATYDERYRVTRLERVELITATETCAAADFSIVGDCVPNCTNFFTEWQKPTVKSGMTIAPNPTTGITNVSIDAIYNGTCRITISDYSGGIIFSVNATFSNGQAQIDLSSLRDGTYYLSIYYGSQWISTELITIQK